MFDWFGDLKSRVLDLENKLYDVIINTSRNFDKIEKCEKEIIKCEKHIDDCGKHIIECSSLITEIAKRVDSGELEKQEDPEELEYLRELEELNLNKFVEVGRNCIWLNGECYNRQYYNLLCVEKIDKCSINVVLVAASDFDVTDLDFPKELEFTFKNETETKIASRLIFNAFEKS